MNRTVTVTNPIQIKSFIVRFLRCFGSSRIVPVDPLEGRWSQWSGLNRRPTVYESRTAFFENTLKRGATVDFID